MQREREALRALLALVRRDAPHLSGKVVGDAEAALASAPAAKGLPAVIHESDPTCVRATLRDPSVREYEVHAARDDIDQNWYIHVTDEGGFTTYDGVWRDSARKTQAEVLVEAAHGSCIKAPDFDPQAQVVATHPAMEAAARWVEARRDAYVTEHGSYDPDTGGTDFPGDGAEYVQELEEIAEGLRALAPLPAPRVDDLAHTVRRIAHALRQAAPSNDLPGKALDYLKRHGLQGSPLRAAQEQGEQRPELLPSLARWSQHG